MKLCLLQMSHDIRAMQELLGRSDMSTMMIYTHTMNPGAAAIRSATDHLMSPYPGSIRPTGINYLIQQAQEIQKDNKSSRFHIMKQRQAAAQLMFRLSNPAVPAIYTDLSNYIVRLTTRQSWRRFGIRDAKRLQMDEYEAQDAQVLQAQPIIWLGCNCSSHRGQPSQLPGPCPTQQSAYMVAAIEVEPPL